MAHTLNKEMAGLSLDEVKVHEGPEKEGSNLPVIKNRDDVLKAIAKKTDEVTQGLLTVKASHFSQYTYKSTLAPLLINLNALIPQRNRQPSSEQSADSLLNMMLLACEMLHTLQDMCYLQVGPFFTPGDEHLLLNEYIPNYQGVMNAISRGFGTTEEIRKRNNNEMKNYRGDREEEILIRSRVATRRERMSEIKAHLNSLQLKLQANQRRRRDSISPSLNPSVVSGMNSEIRDFVYGRLPSEEDNAKKSLLRQELEGIIKTKWPTCTLHIFGSSNSGLGFGSADMDLCLEIDLANLPKTPRNKGDNSVDEGEEEVEEGSKDPVRDRQRAEGQMVLALEELFSQPEYKDKFTKMEAIDTARVPIIKLHVAESDIDCDICINNTLALQNTRLLKTYTLVDDRLVHLALAAKYWAKMRGIGDPSNCTLSSYALVNMLIYYLQQTTPPVLPNLQSPALCRGLVPTNGVIFCSNINLARGMIRTPNTQSVASLLYGFMRYYACTFDIKSKVVAISAISRPLEKRSYSASTGSRRWRLAIRDPLEEPHDLASVIYDPIGQMMIIDEFERACEKMHRGQFLQDVCEARADIKPLLRTCQTCGETDHISKDCALDFGRLCLNCDKPGHMLRSCPEPPSREMGSCHRCGQYGHWSKDCKGTYRDSRVCYNCNETGHVSRDCPIARRPRGMGMMNMNDRVSQRTSNPRRPIISQTCPPLISSFPAGPCVLPQQLPGNNMSRQRNEHRQGGEHARGGERNKGTTGRTRPKESVERHSSTGESKSLASQATQLLVPSRGHNQDRLHRHIKSVASILPSTLPSAPEIAANGNSRMVTPLGKKVLNSSNHAAGTLLRGPRGNITKKTVEPQTPSANHNSGMDTAKENSNTPIQHHRKNRKARNEKQTETIIL